MSLKQETLSVAIISFNEHEKIGKTLDAIKDIADEIVVVDSHSTDSTTEIAKDFGATVYVEDWKGYAEQKNSALAKCTSNWILFLDADEVVSKSLSKEIIKATHSSNAVNGYKVARELYIGKKLIKHGGYFPDYQLRLFKNNIGAKFLERSVQESVSLSGEIKLLKNPLKHYAYKNLKEYEQALKKYAKLASAEINAKKNFMPITRALWAFFYRYVVRLGFLEGSLGFNMIKLYSNYVFEKYSLAKNNTKTC